MKIYFDTEFTGLYKNTNLISIGLITEDGNDSFYGENISYTDGVPEEYWNNDFIQNHVIKNTIMGRPGISITANTVVVGTFYALRDSLIKWLDRYREQEIEFVSDCSHYDMVLLIDLIAGCALDMPQNMCAACTDINQIIADKLGISKQEAFDLNRLDILSNYVESYKDLAPDDSMIHNSLYDADVIRLIDKLL